MSQKSSSIPSSYKAAVVNQKGKGLAIEKRSIPELRPNQVLLKVLANGVCASDTFTYEGMWPGLQLPRVPGHEVVGELVSKGSSVPSKYETGKRYGRGWFGGCCFACEACRRGDFILCQTLWVSGISDDGGYAEYMVCPWESLAAIPDNLSSEMAAPLLCAGVTVFNSLRNAGAVPPATVAVVGLGGLGHLGIQFANRMGYKTIAISGSDKKKDLAMKLGAHDYIDSSKQDPAEALQKIGGARVILSTMSNAEMMTKMVSGLGQNGVLITLGGSMEPLKVASAQIIGNKGRIQGWPSGTSKDSEDTLLFASLFGIEPQVTKFSLDDAQKAYDAMSHGKIHGRAVIVP